ncbi:Brain-specific angiogenesis inhibitor 1-associated protein 2 [Geodia barretti]|nr:Brain-specific angiogenesis inhibitor 1-associated protein 2 [Geodia barretti]
MHSMNTDFIVPLETKLDAEEKTLMDMHKTYRQENGKRESSLSKTRDQIRSLKKKTNAQHEKLAQLKQIESDQTECLHQTRVEGLRKALLEERRMYCFVLDHLTSVIRNEVAYNATSHEELSARLNGLRTLTSTPNELPEESAALLIDPRSPRAFPPSSHDDVPDIGEDKAPMEVESTMVKVKAIHPHKPTDSSQLELKMGDLIEADENSQQNGWLLGKNFRTGVTGWFPVQFVTGMIGPASTTDERAGEGVVPGSSQQQQTGQLPPRDYMPYAARPQPMMSPPQLPEKDY